MVVRCKSTYVLLLTIRYYAWLIQHGVFCTLVHSFDEVPWGSMPQTPTLPYARAYSIGISPAPTYFLVHILFAPPSFSSIF